MPPKKILVIRFSAMGDVMLLVPVLRSLLVAHPETEITLVTRPRFASLFSNISGLHVFEADVDHTYNGLLGMRDLFKALMRKGPYDHVFDLHDHLRTMILRNFFKLFGNPVSVFKKGRAEKKAFTRRENKVTEPLPHTVERYASVFKDAGFDFTIIPPPYLTPDAGSVERVKTWMKEEALVKTSRWIGIAPFAMHYTKMWPLENYEKLIASVIEKTGAHIFFFGGGEKEIGFFEDLCKKFEARCTLVAGRLKIKEEIAFLKHLDLMLCVDSSNMHLAALTGTPLLSIWGGTLPDVGFGPFGCTDENIIQVPRDELSCRPCSVYGKDKCFRGDFACMNSITHEQVLDRMDRLS